MEAITIGGLAVLAVGGYYSAIDFLNDIGIRGRWTETKVKKLPVSHRCSVTPQPGVKKMARLYV
jgi:hypothetical protein